MPKVPRLHTGLDLIENRVPKGLRNQRVGLLVHPASVNRRLEHASKVLLRIRDITLSAFFGPQHGIRGETQDNMIEWEGFRDPATGLPVFSLYGEARKPGPEMLSGLDAVVIDLQDVGARYYTFIWTMALVMEACAECGIKVVILDRPNPIGGQHVEGPSLDEKYSSFVGLHPLPVRHGMTIGEIGLYLKDNYCQNLDLIIVRMKGWKRRMWFDSTGLPWVMPSPNMPTLDTAQVYPGMCLLEGTNISEGRGTTRPFEIFGAPFIDPDRLIARLDEFGLPGVVFRPLYFLPTFQKYAGVLCGGGQIHPTDRQLFRPFLTAVAILKAVHDLYPGDFAWKQPPYEYEETLLPIDILSGSDRLRREVEEGSSLGPIDEWCSEDAGSFDSRLRLKYLIYD